MTTSVYSRPTKTKASALGHRGRTFWARNLRKRAYDLIPTVEIIAAEEPAIATIRQRPGQDRAAWTSIRTRFEQAALLDLLRARHFKNTGKEISRNETLAALMASGLETIINRDEFKSLL